MTMNGILTSFVAFMLLCNTLYLGARVRSEMLRYRQRKEERMQISTDGSFTGIDAGGNLISPQLDANGRLERGGLMLAFVVHSDRLAADVSFWNRAIELTGRSRTGEIGQIQYWGVCDRGMACQSSQADAKFKIIGYIDPHQMHTLAEADTGKAALLYDRALTLRARLPIGPDPVAESALLVGEAK